MISPRALASFYLMQLPESMHAGSRVVGASRLLLKPADLRLTRGYYDLIDSGTVSGAGQTIPEACEEHEPSRQVC